MEHKSWSNRVATKVMREIKIACVSPRIAQAAGYDFIVLRLVLSDYFRWKSVKIK